MQIANHFLRTITAQVGLPNRCRGTHAQSPGSISNTSSAPMSPSLFLIVAAAAAATPEQAAPSSSLSKNPPPSDLCDTPGHRQFDFWVGRWNVHRADTDQLVARSVIQKVYRGCAVQENWMPLDGAGGGSLNSYRPKINEWRQFWTDAANEVHDYTGAWDGQRMLFTGTSVNETGGQRILRMTFERLRDGNVVQTGYESPDEGKSWETRYRLVYRRAP